MKYFPEVMNTQGRHLVQVILKIKSKKDITTYMSYTPEQWIIVLGKEHYVQYLPTLVNLLIIWTMMFYRNKPADYEE